MGRAMPLFGDATFRRYFAGQAMSRLGDSVVPLALAFAVLSISNAPTAMATVLVASRAPAILMVLIGGVVGDLASRRLLMVTADVVRALVQAATAALLLTHHAELWSLVVLQILSSTASAFFEPAAQGLLPQVVPVAGLQSANALLGLSRSAAAVVAQPVSAWVIVAAGPGWAFALDAATYLASVAGLLMIKTLRPAPADDAGGRPAFFPQLSAGWQQIRSRPWLLAMTLHSAVINACAIAPFLVLGPIVAKRDLNGAASWGAIATAYAAGSVLGGVVALRVAPRRPLFVALSTTFALVPVFLLLALSAPVWLIAAAAVLAGAENSFLNTIDATVTQAHVPNEAMARVNSFVMLGAFVFFPLGLAVTGPAAATVGVSATLIGGAGLAVAATVAALLTSGVTTLTFPDRSAELASVPGAEQRTT